jgi:hypothetical protein
MRSKSRTAAATSGRNTDDVNAKGAADSKHSSAKASAHILGRSAVMEKASKLGLKLGMSGKSESKSSKDVKSSDEAQTRSKTSLTALFTYPNSRSMHSNVTLVATQKDGDKSGVNIFGNL